MQKKLELFAKVLIGATFFVPLIVLPSNFIFPFVVPKIVLFRSLVLLMLASYLILLASDWRRYRVRMTPITIAIGLFFLSFLVSTFVGVDWYRSFWDNHERMLGLFTVTHYILYYLVVTTLVREWRDWRWLFRTFLLAGSLVMLVGVWQKFVNPDALLNQGNPRVSATLGNPIYYSAYGLFLFFLGTLLALKEQTKHVWFWLSVLGAFLGLLGIFLGGTRGTVLGLGAGIGVLCLSYAVLLKDHPKARRAFTGIIVVGIVIVGFLFAFRNTETVRNIPTIGRLVNTDISDGTANTRIMAWGIAVDAWQERPVFGWGPNNYFYAFNEYYRPEFLRQGYGETWFDNAHNIVMNTLAVQGTIGILTYIGVFAVAIWVLFRRRESGALLDAHVVSIGAAFLVGHFVSNVFVFENPTSYLYFFFFLAFLNSVAVPKNDTHPAGSARISSGLLVTVAFVILFLIYATNIQPARANMAVFHGIRSIFTERVSPLVAYEAATRFPTPHIDDVRSDFARNLVPAIQGYEDEPEAGVRLAEFLYEELEKNRELHPLDIRNHMFQAQISQAEAEFHQTPELLLRAEADLEEALLHSPKRQQLQYMLSTIKLQIRKNEEAVALLEESIANDPQIGEGWWRLAVVYEQLGHIEKAKEVIHMADERGVSLDQRGREIADSILAL